MPLLFRWVFLSSTILLLLINPSQLMVNSFQPPVRFREKTITYSISNRVKFGVLYARKGNRGSRDELIGVESPKDKTLSDWYDDLASNRMESDQSLDSQTIARLKAEVAAPFRLLRYFIYGGVGAAAGLGTFVNIPQLILAFRNQDGDKANAVTNLAIDLAGMAGAGFLWYKESQSEKKTVASFTDKQLKLDSKLSPLAAEERERKLSLLPVEIIISEQDENVTRVVSLGDLQSKGNQNVILVAGKRGFVKDAVISARLEGSDLFNSKETVVIPFVYNYASQLDDAGVNSKSRGFAAKEPLMSAPYIGTPRQVPLVH